jgi:superfamily II helicase
MSTKNNIFEAYQKVSDKAVSGDLTTNCKNCSAELVVSYLSDYNNMYIEELSICPECGKDAIKTIHLMH